MRRNSCFCEPIGGTLDVVLTGNCDDRLGLISQIGAKIRLAGGNIRKIDFTLKDEKRKRGHLFARIEFQSAGKRDAFVAEASQSSFIGPSTSSIPIAPPSITAGNWAEIVGEFEDYRGIVLETIAAIISKYQCNILSYHGDSTNDIGLAEGGVGGVGVRGTFSLSNIDVIEGIGREVNEFKMIADLEGRFVIFNVSLPPHGDRDHFTAIIPPTPLPTIELKPGVSGPSISPDRRGQVYFKLAPRNSRRKPKANGSVRT